MKLGIYLYVNLVNYSKITFPNTDMKCTMVANACVVSYPIVVPKVAFKVKLTTKRAHTNCAVVSHRVFSCRVLIMRKLLHGQS